MFLDLILWSSLRSFGVQTHTNLQLKYSALKESATHAAGAKTLQKEAKDPPSEGSPVEASEPQNPGGDPFDHMRVLSVPSRCVLNLPLPYWLCLVSHSFRKHNLRVATPLIARRMLRVKLGPNLGDEIPIQSRDLEEDSLSCEPGTGRKESQPQAAAAAQEGGYKGVGLGTAICVHLRSGLDKQCFEASTNVSPATTSTEKELNLDNMIACAVDSSQAQSCVKTASQKQGTELEMDKFRLHSTPVRLFLNTGYISGMLRIKSNLYDRFRPQSREASFDIREVGLQILSSMQQDDFALASGGKGKSAL